jgi:ribosomal protein L10
MNYKKKKNLLFTKWIKHVLSKFDCYFIFYVKPSNDNSFIEIKKNIKIIATSVLKNSILFSRLKLLSLFNGKLAIIYLNFNSNFDIKSILNTIEQKKKLVPIICYRSNRFLNTSEILVKNQICNNFAILKELQIKLTRRIAVLNMIIYNMLKFHNHNIYNKINNIIIKL